VYRNDRGNQPDGVRSGNGTGSSGGAPGLEHAAQLQGKVLLLVGELDTNVGPSSTLQVVSALMKANKTFDFLMIPGAEHNAGRGGEYVPYGERKRFDFFVRHLLGQNPPDWSTARATRAGDTPGTRPQ